MTPLLEVMVHRRLEQLLRRELYGGSARVNSDGNRLFVAEDSFNAMVESTLPWLGLQHKTKIERLQDMAKQWWEKFGDAYKQRHAEQQ